MPKIDIVKINCAYELFLQNSCFLRFLKYKAENGKMQVVFTLLIYFYIDFFARLLIKIATFLLK